MMKSIEVRASLPEEAIEIMTRRGWTVEWSSDGGISDAWFVYGKNTYKVNPIAINGPGFFYAAHPMEALRKADQWYRENRD